MTKKTEKAYDASLKEIEKQSSTLSRGEYCQYIDELTAYLKCLQDCNREQEQESESA